MIRLLFYLLGAVLALSLIKSAIEMITRIFGNFSQAAGSGGNPRKPAVPLSEALKKDPVCGAYVAPSASIQKTIGSGTLYFCSLECRDKYLASM